MNVSIVRVFLGWTLKKVFSVWAHNSSRLLWFKVYEPLTGCKSYCSWLYFFLTFQRLCIQSSPCATSTCPSTKRLPIVLYQHEAASLKLAVLTAPPIDETIFYLRKKHPGFRSPTWDLCSWSICVPMDKPCGPSTGRECLPTSFRPRA